MAVNKQDTEIKNPSNSPKEACAQRVTGPNLSVENPSASLVGLDASQENSAVR